MNKKGAGPVWDNLYSAVIIGIVIVIMLILFNVFFRNFTTGLNSCEAKGGECMAECGGYEPLVAGNGQCTAQFKDQAAVCCRVPQVNPQEARGVGANRKFITLSVNKNPVAGGATIDADPSSEYAVSAQVNLDEVEKADESEIDARMCGIFLKNTLTQERFKVNEQGDMERTELLNSHMVNCQVTNPITIKFKPTEINSGETYELNVIVYDVDISRSMTTLQPQEFEDLLTDTHNWVSHNAIYFKVKKVIEVVDVSSTWVSSDDITIRTYDPYKLSALNVTIVSDADLEAAAAKPGIGASASIYRKLQQACTDTKDYQSALNKITALKGGSNGVSLGIYEIGKDNKQQASYESQDQPITFTETSSKIHLDASTIIEDFYRPRIGDVSADKFKPFTDERLTMPNYYLCAKAKVSKGKSADIKEITTFSVNPLKLDIAPPFIQNTDEYIQVVYPQPFRSQLDELISRGIVQQGQKVTSYYFQEYPKIVIKQCLDKSGCVNYDYYFAPTQIEMNINTDSLETGAAATALGIGLNLLHQYLIQRNPLDTVCPLGTGNQYRRNTAPEIRFRDKQGVMCIRVTDAAGNYWLTWKPVYNPYDIFEKMAAGITPSSTDIRPQVG